MLISSAQLSIDNEDKINFCQHAEIPCEFVNITTMSQNYYDIMRQTNSFALEDGNITYSATTGETHSSSAVERKCQNVVNSVGNSFSTTANITSGKLDHCILSAGKKTITRNRICRINLNDLLL